MKLSKIFPLLILCLVFLCLVLSGCDISKVKNEQRNDVSMFVNIEKSVIWSVYYHKDTKVMYVCSGGGYNSGNMTVMLDEDGKPLLWKGEVDE